MTRIADKFKELQNKKEKALITYITAGDPSLSVTEKLVYEMEKTGADIIELGIPFSDPLADGPTIQASHLRALEEEVSAKDIFRLITKIRKKSKIPIALLVSYNLLINFGVNKFLENASRSKVDSLIVPDLPPEEATYLKGIAKAEGVDTVFLVAPTSTEKRIKDVSEASTGFIYLVSLTGITGERKEISLEIKSLVEKLRMRTKKPIVVGFGISKPPHVKEVCKIADGAIVGSAIIKVIESNLKKKTLVKAVGGFVKKLKSATK